MNILRKYWFNFENFDRPTPLNLGCGVTAHDREDAINLIRERIFESKNIPRIINVTDDVTFQALDQGHVAPNVGDMTMRGIWFPQGYDEVRE